MTAAGIWATGIIWMSGACFPGIQATVSAQHQGALVRHRLLLPTARHDLGYVIPPFLLLGTSGVVAVDGMDHRIIVLDSAGGAVRTVSERGEGPGQFLASSALVLRGDSLILTDQSLRRATVFDVRTGTLLTTWPIDTELRWSARTVRPLAVFRKDCWLGVVSHVTRQTQDERQPFRTLDVVLRIRTVGGRVQVDSLLSRDSRGAWIHPLGEMVLAKVPSVVATRPQFMLGPDGNGFTTFTPVEGSHPGVSLQVWQDACAARTDSAFVPIKPRVLSENEVRTLYRTSLADRSTQRGQLDEAVEDAVKQTRKKDGRFLAPLYAGVLMGSDGVMWVEVAGISELADYGRPRVWWRIGPGGRQANPVIVPSNVRLQAVGPERAIGWVTSDAGSQVVELRWQ